MEKQTLEKRIKTFQAIRLDWEESERGWGIRPDGCSLHKTPKDCDAYVKKYWKGMPSEVPDEYSRPAFGSKPYAFEVDRQTYRKISASKNGIRLWHSETIELEKKLATKNDTGGDWDAC